MSQLVECHRSRITWKVKRAVQFQARHLLYENWDGPCIGLRIKTRHYCYGVLIRIPEWISRLLFRVKRLEYPA